MGQARKLGVARVVMLGAAVGALGMVVGLTGCDTTKAPYTPRADTIAQQDYPQVTVTGDLRKWVALNTPVVEKGDVMKVSVPVRLMSDTGEYARVQYRFQFLDKNGVPMRVQPDWRFQTLEPRNQVFLTANSMDAGAEDWRLEIRSAR